ncbi:g5798 [Coccomyxa elongata]
MAANQPDQPPSGPGQARRLAQQTAAGLAVGETITMAVKTATLLQLTSIMAFGCARGGFPTFNRHLYQDQLHGMGWQELQPLLDNQAKGAEALQTSLDTLRYFGAAKDHTDDYQEIFQRALNGEAADRLHHDRQGGAVPRYLAYEHVKVRILGPGGRRQREHKMLIYCWRRELDFPDAPVFHAQPVNLDAPQSQYGALNVPPKSIFPEAFTEDLGKMKKLKLHIVGAVYGAKRAWADEHGGEEPPPHVVDAWGALRASHLLEGPISLRRNFNPRFLTLQSEWGNKLRHACVAAVLRKLVNNMLPPDASSVLRQHLVESQATGSQPQADEFSLDEGNELLLSQMRAEECEIELLYNRVNEDICAKLHPETPCKFWRMEYGAVPDAVSTTPINEKILCAHFLVWPPEPEPEPEAEPEAEAEADGPSEEPPAKRAMTPQPQPYNWRRVKTSFQAKEKLMWFDLETEKAWREIDAAGERRTEHPRLKRLRNHKSIWTDRLEELEKKEAAQGYVEDDP